MGVTSVSTSRPQFRNIHITQILGYRLPLAGIVSILHRVSGAVLFLFGLPLMLYALEQSLVSEMTHANLATALGHPLVKLLALGLIWGFLHHAIAGVRYLVLDLHIGTGREQAKSSARLVLILSLALTAVVALKLFGAI
ncbi:MAG: succinate dehydrogenase, cytochrome b556 subunit [Betaproteobacteria bacterium]|nr:succinate dehydrogenase, cytochrome b556 subunit [Betaproteobacteria bacterium]